MFSSKEDAMGPKQDFKGSAAKGKKLPSDEKTNEPEKEFGTGEFGSKSSKKSKKGKMRY